VVSGLSQCMTPLVRAVWWWWWWCACVLGRPDARGVFQTVAKDFVVWVNDKDHMRVIASQNGSDLQKVFLRFCEVHAAVESAIKGQGLDFIRNDRCDHTHAHAHAQTHGFIYVVLPCCRHGCADAADAAVTM
jgi:hypothetical protein